MADILFIGGSVWQASTTSVWGMIAGRGVVGAAVGSASFVVPLYIGELAPGPWRGRMVTVSSLFITGGQVVAYVVGWWFSSREHGWRWMVGMGALPAVVQALIFVSMPETPRWLIKAGKTERARRVLERVYDGSEGMETERLVGGVLRRVEREILEEEDALSGRDARKQMHGLGAKLGRVQENFAQLVGVGANRRALAIACMLQGAQQLCGFVSRHFLHSPLWKGRSKAGYGLMYVHAELPHVLLRDHLRPRRLSLSNLDFPLHRLNKLCLHTRRLPLY